MPEKTQAGMLLRDWRENTLFMKRPEFVIELGLKLKGWDENFVTNWEDKGTQLPKEAFIRFRDSGKMSPEFEEKFLIAMQADKAARFSKKVVEPEKDPEPPKEEQKWLPDGGFPPPDLDHDKPEDKKPEPPKGEPKEPPKEPPKKEPEPEPPKKEPEPPQPPAGKSNTGMIVALVAVVIGVIALVIVLSQIVPTQPPVANDPITPNAASATEPSCRLFYADDASQNRDGYKLGEWVSATWSGWPSSLKCAYPGDTAPPGGFVVMTPPPGDKCYCDKPSCSPDGVKNGQDYICRFTRPPGTNLYECPFEVCQR